MKRLKRIVARLFFGLEIIIFAGFYIGGPHGLLVQRALERENRELLLETQKIQNELLALNDSIAQWDAHPFFKEKIAREQLQMAREGDQIYYIS